MAAGTNRKDSRGRVLRQGEYERQDGRFSFIYLNPVTGKKSYAYATSLAELRKKEKAIQSDIADGIDTAGAALTLNELFERNMRLKNNLRKSTAQNYRAMWRSNVQGHSIGSRKVGELKPMHIQAFYAELQENGKKSSTIKLIHNLIYSCLEMAVENDLIRKNPAKNGMKQVERDASERIPLNQEQLNNLLEFCRSGIYSTHVPFIQIAVDTCLRCSELCGLTWQDVDLKARTVNVNHQLIYKNLGNGCKFYIQEPKTDAGTRIIPMTERTHNAFLEIKKINMQLGRRCNKTVDGFTDFVFLSGSGAPMAVNAVNSFLANIEQQYNKQHPEEPLPHLSAHILRHTGATRYSRLGMDLKALQALMGHSDVGVTMNVYVSGADEWTASEVHRLEAAMNA